MPNWEQPPSIKDTNVFKALKQELNKEYVLTTISDGQITVLLDRIIALEEKLATLTS